ncbi:MAG: hypothetical protein KGJ90_06270 [Patescibacteria group bacterium]|nr:hypothetical protein [Patescibacteria group bacterium]
MSAQQTNFIQQVSDLSAFRDLVEIIKNPRQLIDAHETARKEMELTKVQEAKLKEAHEFMGKYDEFLTALESGKAELEAKKKEFADYSASGTAIIENEKAAIASLRAELDKREVNLNENTRIHIENKKHLEAESAELARQRTAMLEDIQSQKAKNDAFAKANLEKQAQLEKWEGELKQKAAKLKEQIASF